MEEALTLVYGQQVYKHVRVFCFFLLTPQLTLELLALELFGCVWYEQVG